MKPHRFSESLNCAVEGILFAFRNERTMKAHYFIALLVILLSLWFDLSTADLLLIIIAVSLVLITEMVNTAIETIVDQLSPEINPLARTAKDVAAGAVLLACLNSVAIGYLVLYKVFKKPFIMDVFTKLKSIPTHITFIILIVLLVAVMVFKTVGKRGSFTRGGMVSGHSAIAFGSVVAIYYVTENPLATLLAFVVALLVAQSRVEADFHNWIEACMGGLLGTVLTLLIFQIFYR
jgi:diacylglycerol kinase (ATP)